MFDTKSRYANLPVATLKTRDADGREREIRYVTRRFIPAVSDAETLVEHRVVQGERLDTIAARYLGDPTQFWRVADANAATRPELLVEPPGRRIRIALPRP
ncbi:MAG TPA: LysM domain-containing protein [Longimicrobiales bacterium]